MSFLPLFLLLAGYVIGLGAVTVIEIHGFLGRTSPYWNEATIRSHKVTKPLIWLGMGLALLGGIWFFGLEGWPSITRPLALISCTLLVNGSYLSFVVSPNLLRAEREGRSQELLPKSTKRRISFGFIVSMICWWGSLALVVNYLVQNLHR